MSTIADRRRAAIEGLRLAKDPRLVELARQVRQVVRTEAPEGLVAQVMGVALTKLTRGEAAEVVGLTGRQRAQTVRNWSQRAAELDPVYGLALLRR